MKLRSSKLQDDMLLEEFYDKVIEAYDCAENYYIILSMRCMMFRENLPTGSKCSTRLTKCMNICL